MSKKGESQRIYWQQWLNNDGSREYNRRELITSSAAIRINPDNAKASDVTQLLRDTLKLSSPESVNDTSSSSSIHKDSLVLVGTLYSLPKDYIQFEHEPPAESTDPFHVLKTLQPGDNPLLVRDQMMEHLQRLQHEAPSTTSNISPKFQWYFVPENVSGSSIPSCIELDGYCTSMEEEELRPEDEDDDQNETHGNDETDTQDRGGYFDVDLLLSRCPFVDDRERNGNAMEVTGASLLSKKDKELRRYFQLCQVPPSSSGYLLKQSSVDPHVWKRVYCVLTDDHLWYTTRVPYTNESKTTPISLRMGKTHGRISLGRALLLEPNPEYSSSPLFRVPHSFEVVNSRGTSHVFRAPTRILQRQWVAALTTKIMQSFENSLMDQAELIVADETMARNRRFFNLAVEPLCDGAVPSPSMYLSLIRDSVLRLGMSIAEYRELCRHVQAMLPAKHAVMATSERNGKENGDSGHFQGNALLDDEAHEKAAARQIQNAWNEATQLLDRATNVALEVQQYTQHQRDKQTTLSHSLETHRRHIEYVLTGNHGPARTTGGVPSDQRSAPPVELFDLLLSELHSLVQRPQKAC